MCIFRALFCELCSIYCNTLLEKKKILNERIYIKTAVGILNFLHWAFNIVDNIWYIFDCI